MSRTLSNHHTFSRLGGLSIIAFLGTYRVQLFRFMTSARFFGSIASCYSVGMRLSLGMDLVKQFGKGRARQGNPFSAKTLAVFLAWTSGHERERQGSQKTGDRQHIPKRVSLLPEGTRGCCARLSLKLTNQRLLSIQVGIVQHQGFIFCCRIPGCEYAAGWTATGWQMLRTTASLLHGCHKNGCAIRVEFLASSASFPLDNSSSAGTACQLFR